MINRYDQPLRTITLTDGRTVYRTARPTVVETSPSDIRITVGEQDRFDIIAQNVYGSAAEWWRVASANGMVDGSLTVPIGTDIVIPPK